MISVCLVHTISECPDHHEQTKPVGCITRSTVATFVPTFSGKKRTRADCSTVWPRETALVSRGRGFHEPEAKHCLEIRSRSASKFFVVCRYVERNALRAGLVDRTERWRWGSLWRWLRNPEPEPKLLSPWPLPRLPGWTARVNECPTKQELDSVRLSTQRGKPLGDDAWVKSIARRLNLECTMRLRGRPGVRFPDNESNKEA